MQKQFKWSVPSDCLCHPKKSEGFQQPLQNFFGEDYKNEDGMMVIV